MSDVIPTSVPPAPLPSGIVSQIDWIFFDLDGTLWDHALASFRALTQVCGEFSLPADMFIPLFERANREAWAQLGQGRTTRDRMRLQRFEDTLIAIDPSLLASLSVDDLSRRYLSIYLETPTLYWLEGAREVLRAAAGAGKRIAVLTSGFPDVQACKLDAADEGRLVEFLWSPAEAGCLKPRPEFFTTALGRAGCSPRQALMIGDSFTDDIQPSLALGLHAWWLNPCSVALPGGAAPQTVSFPRLCDLLPLFNSR